MFETRYQRYIRNVECGGVGFKPGEPFDTINYAKEPVLGTLLAMPWILLAALVIWLFTGRSFHHDGVGYRWNDA